MVMDYQIIFSNWSCIGTCGDLDIKKFVESAFLVIQPIVLDVFCLFPTRKDLSSQLIVLLGMFAVIILSR